jgi:hypothetical protein
MQVHLEGLLYLAECPSAHEDAVADALQLLSKHCSIPAGFVALTA